ncbi:DNA polymerase I [Aquitalea magnusonii]|uniref:DNA-directed DNA polymerase n=1 Tax=Aquitalea magnusonii TaxID=332411 RepID=A0A3G9GQK5_9NEIS|nr:DNA polymerase [Aquitalea magnusonii]BBF87187.1 DNA polymerase I [Aquitalea magnusonii]
MKNALDAQKLSSLLIMQVHDELVLEVPDTELELVKQQLPQIMAGVAQLKVPLLAEVGAGSNWEAAH